MSERNLYHTDDNIWEKSNLLQDKGYFEVDLKGIYSAGPNCKEIDKWCEVHLLGEFFVTGGYCYFQHREDMVKFGLTWL